MSGAHACGPRGEGPDLADALPAGGWSLPTWYVDAVDVVRGLLGEASAHDIDKALELARSGPPEEEVGLEPFGPPELMGGRR